MGREIDGSTATTQEGHPAAAQPPPALKSTREVLKAALWSLLDVDRRLRQTLVALARRPEAVTHNWLAGNPSGYYEPFKLLALATVLTFVFHFLREPPTPEPNALSLDTRAADIRLEPGPAEASSVQLGPALQVLARWHDDNPQVVNLVQMVLLLGALAVVCRLMLARTGIRTGHWLVLHTYVAGGYFFALLPLSVAEFVWPHLAWLRYVSALLSYTLHIWATVRMLGAFSWMRLALSVGVVGVALALWVVLLIVASVAVLLLVALLGT